MIYGNKEETVKRNCGWLIIVVMMMGCNIPSIDSYIDNLTFHPHDTVVFHYDDELNINNNDVEQKIHSNDSVPSHIIGVWNIYRAEIVETGEEYPLQLLYGSGIHFGGILTINDNGTFSKYIGIHSGEIERHEGTYHFENNMISFVYLNNHMSFADYLIDLHEIRYYAYTNDGLRIGEYFKLTQMLTP